MFELAGTPLDMGGIFQQGIALGRLAFRRVFMLTSLLSLTVMLRTGFLVWGAGDVPVDFDFMMQRFGQPRSWFIVAMALVSLFIYALLYKRIAVVARGRTEGLDIELREALRIWPWLILAGIVYSISVMVGLVLFIVPGLILLLSLMFWDLGIILDGKGPIETLNASHNLVWGHWWRTLGLLILIFLPLHVLEAVVGGLLGIDSGAAVGAWPSGRQVFQQAVVEMVSSAVFGPFIYSILFVYYHDLKLRKQAI